MATAKINLTYDGQHFIARAAFKDRKLLSDAGFTFDKPNGTWVSPIIWKAARLREFADSHAKKQIERVMLKRSPWTEPLSIPEGLKPLYYQPIMAKFGLSRNRWYWYADAGLGKTPTAGMHMGTLHAKCKSKFVYLCPSFLIRDVETKLTTWAPHVGVEHFDEPKLFGNCLVLPDSLLHREGLIEEIKYFLRGASYTHLYIDEAHRMKNFDTNRTRFVLGFEGQRGLVDIFDGVGSMSGTALPNRAMELFPNLARLAPETIDFMNEHEFGMRFGAGRWNGHGYEYSGMQNMRELSARIRGAYMFRLKKSELRLPPCTEELLIMDEDQSSEVSAFEHALLKQHSPEDLMRGKLEAFYKYNDMPLPTYQRLLGLGKVKFVANYVKHLVEHNGEKIIVFAKHKEVVKRLAEKLAPLNPIIITGDVPSDRRYDLVKEFQNSKTPRPVIGNLKAMGVGYDMTEAHRCINVEPDWTPATNDQGRDRMHRYGQVKNTYLQYVVFKNSVDRRVLDVVLRKRKLGAYV